LTPALASWRGSIDVVLAVVVDWAGHETSVSTVSQSARARDSESSSGRSAGVALPLCGRRGQDAPPTLAIGDTAIADAILCRSCRAILAAHTILTVGKLTDSTGNPTTGGE